MVLISEVYRYLLSPVEKTFKSWEGAAGMKGKIGRWFRIGRVPLPIIESWGRVFNTLYMMIYTMTQRPWGPLYKRLFEMDMHPGKFYYIFARHRLILFFWFGHTFIYDYNMMSSMKNNSDHLAYFNAKYSRKFPRNTLNWRTSAHYLEISRIYTVEMIKKLAVIEQELAEEHRRQKAIALIK
ncbi:unnamed protein product [Blepharisma stoltei]|uniref:Uncharacterized protein n=1 Tax=Blepharisma stoltei TaxID=1481888 RepID=A0AAU9J102_9CILI|nr:unnamed protein product [Blepharisma stoltei]